MFKHTWKKNFFLPTVKKDYQWKYEDVHDKVGECAYSSFYRKNVIYEYTEAATGSVL